jgi:hypothetical protein
VHIIHESDGWKNDYSPDICIISKKYLNEIPKASKKNHG